MRFPGRFPAVGFFQFGRSPATSYGRVIAKVWQLDARTLWARDATVASEQTAEFVFRAGAETKISLGETRQDCKATGESLAPLNRLLSESKIMENHFFLVVNHYLTKCEVPHSGLEDNY